jgi:restriction endonuclease S subunit
MKKNIILSENGRETIQSRDEVILLFTIDFKDIDTLILDFENLQFISRSPAHEVLKQVEKVKNFYGIECKFISMNTDIEKMFEIIKNTVQGNAQPIKKYQDIRKEDFYSEISGW